MKISTNRDLQSDYNAIKKLILISVGLLLASFTNASDRLTIEPARLLPDYAKSMLLRWTSAGENRMPANGTFVVCDINKDGRLDIVQPEIPNPSHGGDTDLGIFLQGSDGQFVKQPLVPIHTTCTLRILAADFNGDGKLDLMANGPGNDMVLALGNGDGTFRDARFLGLSASYYPAVGDFDGDSHLDLVAGASSGGTVMVFSGTGDGFFIHRTNLTAAISPRGGCNHAAGAILVGDMNRDGKQDIVVASVQNNATEVGSLYVFLGNGDGSFGAPIITANVASFRGELGDFNGDGFLDYAGDRYNPAQLDIWLGRGDGSFARSAIHSLSGIDPVVVSVVDLNGDGISDVTVCGEPPGSCCETPLSIFLGKGDGTFRSRQTFIGAGDLLPVNVAPQVADFNRDGLPDLLTHGWNTNDAGITIALNNGQTPSREAGFQLTIPTQTNAAVVLEATTDLVTWTSLATNATPRGTWPVVDTAATPHRFYRTRQQ